MNQGSGPAPTGRHRGPTEARAAAVPYHPALDGMRALAVAAVLAFHGGVAALPGGFLGVDAFFVLSGFLITSLLLAERARTGRIALVAFWARRARRLLPALLLMLGTVAVAGRWLLPGTELGALRADLLAALGYVANWRMSYRGGDYFAVTASPSPLQHTWSLGIEEQFYLLWPLLAVLLLIRVRLLLGVAVAGALLSAGAAAALYAPGDVDRAYYGTDTRAAALLVGCALALLLAGRTGRDAPRPAGRWGRSWPGALALAGLVGTGWCWTHATGDAPWLYRGGLLGGALAVAVVIAYAVTRPYAPLARLLAVPPLLWLGRISYGVYLWHWPLFGALTADRTGLGGPALLAVRCAATLTVATASYLLLERPVRYGRWFRFPRRPRLAPALAGTAVAGTALLAVVATVPRPVPEPPVGPAAVAATSPAAPASRSPLHRPGRRPGPLPRVTFLGDSVSWSLGTYLPRPANLAVTVRAVQGCGIARLPELRYLGEPHPNYPGCESWDARWRRAVESDDPDLAVILLDRWELMDRRLDGTYRHVGEPAYDAYLNRELGLAISLASARGAHVVLLTAPYTRRAERPDGGLWPEDDPPRVDAWNRLLRAAGAARPGRVSVVDLNRRTCPDGRFTWTAGNVRLRSDGLHFTPEGVRQWIAPWLNPQLAKLSTQGPG
ncbi:acyltransferase family protein [Micromonospora sp. NPDC049559]|uniref:acyltransferase family protein n=1 Tax=Micromonospora sp. NPDC049559 TaxID=3155923 RepID=UPI0034128E26